MSFLPTRNRYLLVLALATWPASAMANPECTGFGETLAGGVCFQDSRLLDGYAEVEHRQGKPYGVRLSRIPRESVLRDRGFTNDDVLVTINGENAIDIGLEGLRSRLDRSGNVEKCTALVRRRAIEDHLDCTLRKNAAK